MLFLIKIKDHVLVDIFYGLNGVHELMFSDFSTTLCKSKFFEKHGRRFFRWVQTYGIFKGNMAYFGQKNAIKNQLMIFS